MLSEQEKEEIKQRLLSKFNLQKIILFGSQARGTSDNKSDVDLLIISELNEDRFNLMDRMRVCLMQLNYAFDVIILTENEFERDKKYPGTVARYATKEGIVLYEQ
ncbi:MAG: DNA polymerase subunit beta [Ignavibacteria bacterium CG22_combo_CG10-13_8_21_14_all_37_15]|nr:MAG: DNA polymerase subunit beta [Ignavibacteria bacterium CG22_combo_CG10-13_8_21_14_all_37_15]